MYHVILMERTDICNAQTMVIGGALAEPSLSYNRNWQLHQEHACRRLIFRLRIIARKAAGPVRSVSRLARAPAAPVIYLISFRDF